MKIYDASIITEKVKFSEKVKFYFSANYTVTLSPKNIKKYFTKFITNLKRKLFIGRKKSVNWSEIFAILMIKGVVYRKTDKS